MVSLGEFLHPIKKESEHVNDTADLFWKEKGGPNHHIMKGIFFEAV
jgi:hypothetical protein